MYQLHRLGRVAARIAAYVHHQHLATLHLEAVALVVYATHNTTIDITIYRAQRLECRNGISSLQRAEVTRMPNLIAGREELLEHIIECAMCI